tara:strand:+ start:295 stop:1125 length:831 start_codon:yes stop_codon:yes gene_type:complete
MDVLNEDQLAYWDGEAGATWVRNQIHLDQLLGPFTQALMTGAGNVSGKAILDLGCGCGETALRLAEQGAEVIGIDLSREMLAHANQRRGAKANPEFHQADGAVFTAERSFDLIVSRFGVMFFNDPEPALRHLRSLLKPDGELLLACWQAPTLNPWMSVGGRAIAPFLPPSSEVRDPKAPGPFAFSDQTYVAGLLARAGYASIEFESVVKALTVATNLDEAMAFQNQIGPAASAFKSLPNTVVAEATAAMRAAIAPFCGASGVVMEGAIWLIRARYS